jgi:hypothetical protein
MQERQDTNGAARLFNGRVCEVRVPVPSRISWWLGGKGRVAALWLVAHRHCLRGWSPRIHPRSPLRRKIDQRLWTSPRR